jgi:hypothetical protein
MAKVYLAPIDPPEVDYVNFDLEAYDRANNEYLEELAALAKQNGTSDLLGEVVRWPRGDGYAQYLIWRTSPLELIWLKIGDAWSVEEALIRGLRVSDVREMVQRERNIRALFAERRAEREKAPS